MSAPSIPLPKSWTDYVKSAMTHIFSLARVAEAATHAEAIESGGARVREAAKVARLEQELALVREELGIKDARMARMPPAKRTHYKGTERLQILELRAARGWSVAQTAERFHVTPATISSWTGKLEEHGESELVKMPEPVNRYPDFVRWAVQRMQALCPRLGKVKIAQILTRAGLHLAASTVGRIRREEPIEPSGAPPSDTEAKAATDEPSKPAKSIHAKYPNHIWNTDLTMVPIYSGWWVAWVPHAIAQMWPFCWWVAAILDHRSRRILCERAFRSQPTSEQMRHLLGQVIAKVGGTPKYLITDQGVQFTSDGFVAWCKRRGIKQRFGAVGQKGSIAVIERFFSTFKQLVAQWLVVPLDHGEFMHECAKTIDWYNGERPHMTLDGATPDEIYFGLKPMNRDPRFEPRPNWPRGSPCAAPITLVKGQPGAFIQVDVEFVSHRRYLPRVTIRRVAA